MAQTQLRGANAGSGTSQIKAGTISNADIHASAAIALSKLEEAVIQADGGQAFTNDQSMGGYKLTNLATPSSSTDAATKAYVDSAAVGIDWKPSVRASTAAALPANTRSGNILTASVNGALNDTGVDGLTNLALNDRILVKNEVTAANNGLYFVSALGDGSNPWTLTRATDADTSAEVTAGLAVWTEEGTVNGDNGFLLTTDNPVTLNTTGLTFTKFSGLGQVTAGSGLSTSGTQGNTLDVNVGNGIQISSDAVAVKLNSTSLSADGNGLKVDYSNFVKRETPTGAINGSNVTFTLATTPFTGSEEVYLNGMLQEAGAGNDYTISTDTITMLSAPLTGDRLKVSYIKNV